MTDNSANDFETELRRRLRPVDAPAGYAERLMAALPAQQKPTVVAFRPKAMRPSLRQFGIPTALAASLLGAVLFGMHVANDRALREEQEGIAASQQLMQALRVTSQKLDLAYEAVNNPPTAGDQENRS
jgi:hypothetical protein